MKQKIEAAIKETLVVENKQSIWRAVEKILLIVEQKQALRQVDVSGALPMYDVDELNEIVKLYNNGEIDLYTCIVRVWNKAYLIGANEGMKAGQLGNDR